MRALPCFAIASVIGCSGGETYSGTFSGTRTNVAFSTTLTWDVTADGSALVGTWDTADGTAGDVNVTVDGMTVTGFMAQTAPCPLTLTVEGTLAGNTITGDAFTSPGTACQAVDASFEISAR